MRASNVMQYERILATEVGPALLAADGLPAVRRALVDQTARLTGARLVQLLQWDPTFRQVRVLSTAGSEAIGSDPRLPELTEQVTQIPTGAVGVVRLADG